MTVAIQHPRQATRRAPQRNHLRVVAPRRRRISSGMVALAMVGCSLLAAVGGHAYLAEGQIRLGHLEAEAAAIQAVNRATVLKVSNLETPERIAQAAGTLHLVQPSEVLQLPSVSLTKVLPPIKIFGMAN